MNTFDTSKNWTMFRQTDNLLAFITGLFTGAIKFLLDANPNYPVNLGYACITALVCGASGYLGKQIIVFIQRVILKRKNNEQDY